MTQLTEGLEVPAFADETVPVEMAQAEKSYRPEVLGKVLARRRNRAENAVGRILRNPACNPTHRKSSGSRRP